MVLVSFVRAIAAFALLSSPAFAEPIIGRASVIDGDTIEVHVQRIRLEGIDAPEGRQTFTEKGRDETVRCGQRAGFFLADTKTFDFSIEVVTYRMAAGERDAQLALDYLGRISFSKGRGLWVHTVGLCGPSSQTQLFGKAA